MPRPGEPGRQRGPRNPETEALQLKRRRNKRSENRKDEESNTNHEPPSQPMSSKPQVEDKDKYRGSLPQSGPPDLPVGADTEEHTHTYYSFVFVEPFFSTYSLTP